MGTKGKYDGFLGFDHRILETEQTIKAGSKLLSHVSASALAIFFVIGMFQFELDGLKGILVDTAYRTQWWKNPDEHVALIGFDDASAIRYEPGSRIPPEEIAQVLESLAQDKPKAVAIIASINERLYTDAELTVIAKSLSKMPQAYVGYVDDESLGKDPPPAILGVAHYLPGFVSRDTFSYGADSVTRRVMVSLDGLPTVYAKIACYIREQKGWQCTHHQQTVGNSSQTYVDWQGPEGTYPIVSSQIVAQRQFPPGTFTGKVVLFGSDRLSKKGADHIFTPYSRMPLKTTLLEGAAQSLVTLIRDDGLFKAPPWFNWFMAGLIAVVTVNMVLFLSPGQGILFVLAEIVVLWVLSWIGLFELRCWADLAHPMVVACLGYYLVIPYRLVDEYRKRWHYQEKSELMIQLEQLKSNFLSLVSHDLKTPIARIQGNAELVLNGDKITDKQRKCVEAIVNTTEDLSQYVETILDLTRIESAQIPVQKATKDINSIILEVVESKRFMATDKNITFVTDLEPIFSFKFDPRLIRRVLSNIVENALKYSPPNSHITLSSKEEGNWIRVVIADQGIGIPPEEQDKVFSKFYRCENELTQNVKGTGLGLYLVKYFVELHQGIIDLKSELGKGSVFTVSLPV